MISIHFKRFSKNFGFYQTKVNFILKYWLIKIVLILSIKTNLILITWIIQNKKNDLTFKSEDLNQ